MKASWLFIAGLAAFGMAGEVVSAQTVNPAVISPDQVAISQPLSQGSDFGENQHRVYKPRPLPPNRGPGRSHDDVRQTERGPALNASIGVRFPGVGSNGYAPPDTNMAVGPNHILQTVNSRYAIYAKNGALLVGPYSLSSLWAPLGSGNGCATNDGGDVVAQYDKLADRFIVTQLGGVTAPYSECIAVSQTSDPAGTYWLYSYAYGTVINDYPKFGVWPTATNSAYLATYNLFADAFTFIGAQLCAYDRTKMLAGDPTAQGICYTIDGDGGYLPSDLDGSIPPLDGTPGYFLNYETTSSLRMYGLSPNFADPGASTLTVESPDIPVAGFSEACAPSYTCVPQQGTSQKLDTVGDRLMYRLAFRNFGDHEAMVVNHSVASGSRVGVRWYELRAPVSTSGAFSLYQQGTYAPDSTYRWMGSAAMDAVGNIGLGYSASSGSIHPAIRYTGRQATDPLGTLGSEVSLVAGTGSQTFGLSRWGDYTAMRIDPVDDCTFWYTNEYLGSNGTYNWSTAFGSFKFASCNPPEVSLSANPSSLTLTRGTSGNTMVTVTALEGFSGTVGLSVVGCPANATCTISSPVTPIPTATSLLNVSTTPSTSIGTYTLTIIGTTAGGSPATTPVSLTVNPPPDFAISANPSSMTLVQVGTGTSTVTVTALYGFNGNVDLAVAGCPSGATCTLPTPVSPTATSLLTISLSTSTATGTYMLTITGTNGSLSHTATVPLTVLPAGTLTNVALPANGGAASASSTYSSAFAADYAINGDRKGLGYWNDATQGGFPDWLEIDFNGTKNISEVDVFSVQDNAQSPIDPTPGTTFTLYGLRNFEVQYWTGSAWAPVPGGAVTNNNLVWRRLTFTALATSKIRVLVTETADGLWSRITEVEAYANLSTNPDFSISADQSSLTLEQGRTGTPTVTVTSLNGFSGNVDLAVTGCPSGATCTLPTPVTPTATSTLTISTSASTSTGTFTLTITGTQAAVSHTVTVLLTVNIPGTLTNVALPANGGAALASSTYSSAFAPANAINGDRKGLSYWNDATPGSFPDWLEIDFSGTRNISEIDVFSAQDNAQSPIEPTPEMTITSYGLRDFEVQYWTGSAWTPIPGGTVTNNNLVWRKFTFAALPTSKIRVVVTATADGLWSRITEVEAYANLSTSPDFSISADPSSLTLVQVGTETSNVTVTSLNGFSGNVDLTVTGCPSGATCTLPTPVSPTATSLLTISLSTSTATGTYTLTVTGTNGALSHTATVSLTVLPAGTLTNVALPANGGVASASSTYSSAFAADYAINGDRKGLGYWNDATQGGFPDWLEIDFNGTKNISEVDVFSVQDNAQSPIDPTPGTTFTLYGLRNFEVQYWTGSAWAPVSGGAVTNNNLVWRRLTFTALATSKIRVLVTETADGLWSRITEVEAYANLSTSPDFSISADPSSMTLEQGVSGTSTVTLTSLNGFSGNVDLAVTGCPSGTTCTLPTPVTPTATTILTVSPSASASTGTFTLTITGTQAAVSHTATVLLTVDIPGTLTNVALPANGGSAVASTFSSAFAPANAINGDRKGLSYWNDATPGSFPDWLEIDFNGTKNISEVDVFSVQDNAQSPIEPTPEMTFTSYGLRNFEVQYWTGSAWAAIPGGTVTNNNLVWRKFTFAALPTSKIRVLVTATADGLWSRITEVEAYTGP
jgi:NedA-like, galactose-binding domain/F5/8 type C domain